MRGDGSSDYKKTRWARVDLEAVAVFLRNAPSIYAYLGREEDRCRRQNNNTLLKQIMKSRSLLRNPFFWLRFFGYAQIFNLIVEASLEAQHSSYFSTSSLHLVMEAMSKIDKLGNEWVWQEENLSFASIGCPAEYVAGIKSGSFQPNVSIGAKKRRARMINSIREYRMELEGFEPEDFEEKVTLNDIEVGDINIEGLKDGMEAKVKVELEKVCQELYKNFHDRLQASPLMLTAVKAFHLSLDWFKLEEVPANASNSMQNTDKSDITEARGWRSGLCGFCKLRETGHVCKECATLCCNLCNTLQVDELTPKLCQQS